MLRPSFQAALDHIKAGLSLLLLLRGRRTPAIPESATPGGRQAFLFFLRPSIFVNTAAIFQESFILLARARFFLLAVDCAFFVYFATDRSLLRFVDEDDFQR